MLSNRLSAWDLETTRRHSPNLSRRLLCSCGLLSLPWAGTSSRFPIRSRSINKNECAEHNSLCPLQAKSKMRANHSLATKTPIGASRQHGGNMMRYKSSNAAVSGALLFLALVLAGPASAHHSVQAQFDIHKMFTVSVTVSKVEWINPHSYLTINVKDADG